MNIEDLIIASLSELKTIRSESKVPSQEQEEDGKLVFPQYYVGENVKRVSEEARFLFVKQLEKEKDNNQPFHYSIEAPTKITYKFTNAERPIAPVTIANAQSEDIAVCLYDNNFEETNLIEFKFGTPGQQDYDRVFSKLLGYEYDLTNYFVHIVAVPDSSKRNTLNSIKNKYSYAIDSYIQQATSNLIIFLFNLNDDKIIRYCVDNAGLQQTNIISI